MSESSRLSSLDDLQESRASLFFIKDLDLYESEKPYRWAGPLTASQEHMRSNIVIEGRENIPVRDIRSKVESGFLSLDQDGFQILSHRSKHTSFLNNGDNLMQYLQETADILKRILAAELVVCYNFKVRIPLGH